MNNSSNKIERCFINILWLGFYVNCPSQTQQGRDHTRKEDAAKDATKFDEHYKKVDIQMKMPEARKMPLAAVGEGDTSGSSASAIHYAKGKGLRKHVLNAADG